MGGVLFGLFVFACNRTAQRRKTASRAGQTPNSAAEEAKNELCVSAVAASLALALLRPFLIDQRFLHMVAFALGLILFRSAVLVFVLRRNRG